MEQHAAGISRIKEELRAFGSVRLLALAGALQLMPENASRVIRLEALAHIAASLEEAPQKPDISTPRLRRVLNDEMPELARFDDPCENAFAESFTFFNGSFMVLPGIVENATFLLKHLAKAIFLLNRPFQHDAFVNEARHLVSAGLAVSDYVCARARISRGSTPDTSARGPIMVPPSARLDLLASAVCLDVQERRAVLGTVGTSEAALRRLVTHFSARHSEEYTITNGPLFAAPLLQSAAGNLLVTLPCDLLAAIRHALINCAIDHEVARELADRYTAALWDSVKEYLRYLDYDRVPLALPNLDLPNAKDGLFELDVDKALYVLLVSDPIAEYDRTEVFGRWNTDEITPRIEQRLRELEEYIYNLHPAPNDFLCLLLFEGIGRFATFGFDTPCKFSRFLMMSAADLETIALLEGGDKLLLWKFAAAKDAIRERCHVVQTNFLDEFATYRKHRYSYYMSDDKTPDVFYLAPGSAGELRREVLRERDFHGAPSFNRGLVGDVASLHGTNNVPLYVQTPLRDDVTAVLVEGLPVPVWVLGPNYDAETAERGKRSYYFHFTDAVAFWLWQVTPSVRPYLAPLPAPDVPILIHLRLLGDCWNDTDVDDAGAQTPMTATTNTREREVRIELTSAARPLFMGADNSGERELLRCVLTGLAPMVNGAGGTLSDADIRSMIDAHAPLGQKKKIMILDLASNPRLDRANIPDYRPLESEDQNDLLDAIGRHIAVGREPGPIPDDERNDTIKSVVTYCIAQLEREVRSLRSTGLLEFVIAHHEAVIREYAFAQLTTPTRLACFHSEPEMTKQLQEQLPELFRTGLADRILIEYLSAQSPCGLRPISLSVLDRLRTLAYNIANYGMVSDSIRYELAPFSLSVLPSGRLGFDRREYEEATERHMELFAASRISQVKAGFARYFRSPDNNAAKRGDVEAVDRAFAAETGYSLTELVTAMDCIVAIGREVDPGVSCIAESAFCERLSRELKWGPDRVRKIANDLLLEPRRTYLQPPAPFVSADVYPWRYNRRLSYLRRPLVLRHGRAGREVVWGNRSVVDARTNIVNLVLSGRFKATSEQLRELLGSINHKDSEAFNDAVADLFAERPGMVVKRRIKKVGNLKGPLGPPGDLDVLSAVPKHRVLYVVECKDLSIARTPAELANEIGKVIGKGEKSIVRKHQTKVAWVQAHLEAVLQLLGVERAHKWRVRGLIVTDEPLVAVQVEKPPIPVLSLVEVRRALETGKDLA